jgi:hypothetical protein
MKRIELRPDGGFSFRSIAAEHIVLEVQINENVGGMGVWETGSGIKRQTIRGRDGNTGRAVL